MTIALNEENLADPRWWESIFITNHDNFKKGSILRLEEDSSTEYLIIEEPIIYKTRRDEEGNVEDNFYANYYEPIGNCRPIMPGDRLGKYGQIIQK